jgi:hypothetical protein
MNVSADIYWAQVPEWLIDTATPRALQIYAILCRHADKDTRDTILLRSTIATRAKCSRKTVDRAIDELVERGAVTVTHRLDDHGDSAANNYRVHFMQQGVATQVSLPLDTDVATGGDIDVAHNQSQSKPEKTRGQHQNLVTAIAEWMTAGTPDPTLTKGEWGRIGKAATELVDIGATPRDVTERGAKWFKGLTKSPQGLVNNWSQLATQQHQHEWRSNGAWGTLCVECGIRREEAV